MRVAVALGAACAILLTVPGCAKKSAQQSRAPVAHTPRPVATLLIESKGVTMPLALAIRTLRFRPFLPKATIVQAALIPPLNVDRQQDHGLAVEYAAQNSALLLSEWPRAGADIASRGTIAGPCAPSPYKADGLLWTTRNGLVMTLQPDGYVELSRLRREAVRLIQAGACGKPG